MSNENALVDPFSKKRVSEDFYTKKKGNSSGLNSQFPSKQSQKKRKKSEEKLYLNKAMNPFYLSKRRQVDNTIFVKNRNFSEDRKYLSGVYLRVDG